jgi:hypothetical protein
VPDCVENLLIYADNDAAGIAAAEKLKVREQQKRMVNVMLPTVGNDWLDYFTLS